MSFSAVILVGKLPLRSIALACIKADLAALFTDDCEICNKYIRMALKAMVLGKFAQQTNLYWTISLSNC